MADSTSGLRISAVINTLNEERRLPFALRSVKSWVDEIIVVDMHSTDATREIAKSFGARVFLHEPLGYADPARAFALEHATGDWILVLDADELVPLPLSERLLEVARRDEADVVVIPWLNYLLGAPLRGTGWGPTQDRHERFFRRGSVAAQPAIHAFLAIQPGARVLELPYAEGLAVVHFNYLDVHHFLDKLNRYTDIEAERVQASRKAGSVPRALVRAGREFVSRFVRFQGFRDGWRGFYLSALMATYRVAVAAKVRERQVNGDRHAVEAAYEAEAEKVLAAYSQSASGHQPSLNQTPQAGLAAHRRAE
jgi:glycosyltransferase involved in cell wall biosynthesis